MRNYGSNSYKKLDIGISLPKDLDKAIDNFMRNINEEDGGLEDCYRSEILFWLKDSIDKLSEPTYEALKDYYVHGGIYNEQ